MPKRLDPNTFDFPVAEIRRGYRSALYFTRLKNILEHDDYDGDHQVLMQVFQKKNAIACGVDEAIALLKSCTGYWKSKGQAYKLFDAYMTAQHQARKDPTSIAKAQLVVELNAHLEHEWVNTYETLEVNAVYDGDLIAPLDPVMHITGNLAHFAHLESVYLGILARATKVATNVNNVVTAANGKEVLFFADRFDRWSNQGSDGYAAFIGGASGVASDAMAAWWGEQSLGTMPHALIAVNHGDIVQASKNFKRELPEVPLVALVDFGNNCVSDSLAVAEAFGKDLYGVRLDTSENMVDVSVAHDFLQCNTNIGDFKPTGVNPVLVEKVRNALDKKGFKDVKIIVSGGFNVEKISLFERLQVPVDSYAVGSSLLQGSYDYTADVVYPMAKAGRKFRDSDKLNQVN